MPRPDLLSLTPSDALLKFAEEGAIRSLSEVPTVERRQEQRVPVIVPVLVQPVNPKLMGLGEPLAAVSRNITKRGFTLVAERWQSHSLFVVRVAAESNDYTLLAEERWQRKVERYTTVGLTIVRQLDDLAFPLDIEP